MSTEYKVQEKYISGCGSPSDALIPIGTRFHNGRVECALNQLLDLFEIVEQSLVIGKIMASSATSDVELIVQQANVAVDYAVLKLTGKSIPEGQPKLLRTQTEVVQDELLEDLLFSGAWQHVKSSAQGYGLRTARDLLNYIKELLSTDKPYFSKWGADSQIEFFDHSKRFSYMHPEAGFDYWNQVLDDEAPIISTDSSISSWKDLKAALRGENASMDESEFCEGTMSGPLRNTIRLVHSSNKTM